MSTFLQTYTERLKSREILELCEELQAVCGVGLLSFRGHPLLFFLQQCVYPRGASEKRVPISTAHVAISPWLESRVGKLPDGDLRDLCTELTSGGRALEFYQGNKLAIFLNKILPKHESAKKRSTKQSRWDAVVRQRRSNQG